ncbi:MAG: GntR family transcriptional regulator [Rhodospirillaceae bacterium]|jgi:DNA-binding GntR family transcriptional regulator|nr:GntR family transcriptional regulator [Rhodospirillaceae bacterium]MBT6205532.1 GntR family transcriptional regulator [Rhodospirillaceae bacterium]MBT7612287.1 GntR family transcriptional regulator [Rhodospirillaceae bacterium]MBT7648510.1 GntR family transcriptional regulator [Rhodospirillaceae bacterium]
MPVKPEAGARRSSRGQWVSEALRDEIQEGRYGPGDRVTEQEVAGRLGVSRTPVREALRRLETEGLLVQLPWRGVVVAELNRAQVLELYAMREVLEGTAARFAAQHADAAEIDLMHDLLNQEARALDDSKQSARINRDLHSTIYSAARNRYLLSTLNVLGNALALLQGTTFSVPGRPEQGLKEHRVLVEAIAARKGDDAEAAARKHIARARQTRLKMLYGSDGSTLRETASS